MNTPHANNNAAARSAPNGRPKGGADSGAEASTFEADVAIVQRCLSGDISGWEQLYSQQHPRLLKTIELLLGASSGDFQLIDEMAARVWFALVRRDARLLARYDPQRHSRLESFLSGLARIEVLRYLRDERRRKAHEFARGHRRLAESRVDQDELTTMIAEFAATLSPAEREYFEETLIAPAQEGQPPKPGQPLSPTNIWQRRHRIRTKLRAYFEDT